MKVLLAAPGTGKTTKISSLIKGKENPQSILILSFTNATINDLLRDLGSAGITDQNCMTLHKFAVKYNHDKFRYVLNRLEIDKLEYVANGVEKSFNELCDFLSVTTFDQMIERFVSYAKHNKAYLQEKLLQFDTLIIDEYQDFNPSEQALIDLLIEQISDVYILGDDDQCIYDFKDASTDRIIELHGTHESLEHEHICYRCPDEVVDPATTLIKLNTKRIDKPWNKSGKSGQLVCTQFTTTEDVANYVCTEVQKIVAETPEEKVLILSPVQFAARDVAEKLNELGVVYRNYFVPAIPEALIMKSWKLKALIGKHQYLNLLLLGYKIYTPRKKFYELIKKHIKTGQDFAELHKLLESRLPAEIQKSYTTIEEIFAETEFSELAELYSNAKGDNEDEKLQALLIQAEEVDDKNIKLMTIHKSKGLGSEHVFMIGLTEGIIPNKKRGTDSIESQRRLFYVGMTRAKKNLHLLSSVKIKGSDARTVNIDDFRFNRQTRTWDGRASRFIEELGL